MQSILFQQRTVTYSIPSGSQPSYNTINQQIVIHALLISQLAAGIAMK